MPFHGALFSDELLVESRVFRRLTDGGGERHSGGAVAGTNFGRFAEIAAILPTHRKGLARLSCHLQLYIVRARTRGVLRAYDKIRQSPELDMAIGSNLIKTIIAIRLLGA